MHRLSSLAIATLFAGLTPGLLGATETAPAAMQVDAESFRCIREMTPVRHFYVDNLLGDLQATLAAANAPQGAVYPPGSVVQLVPAEAMVKREPGFNPVTADWEFFELDVSEQGTEVRTRGFAEVNNRFGGNCFACHVPAREPWDFICEEGRGCAPIPIDRQMTGALQRSDPRCGPAEPADGDRVAMLRLYALVLAGKAKALWDGLF
jgi:hypothetical protein